MADKEKTQDFSMDAYFTNGLAQDAEPNNPFEPKASEKKSEKRMMKDKKQKGDRAPLSKGKKILIVSGVIAAAVLIISLSIFIAHRRNDGMRYARKLSTAIGAQMSSAQDAVSIDLHGQSSYPVLNAQLGDGTQIAESRKQCKVQGVYLPEWAIFCKPSDQRLNAVVYYNYELLEDNALGKERKSYLDKTTVQQGTDIENAESIMNLEPYSVTFALDGSQIREYRYCYKDAETKDMTSYVITAVWNAAGALTDITDQRVDFISTVLNPKVS